MCGIVGFTAPGAQATAILGAMNAALSHRGPDASGIFVDEAIALGHTRLAIIDLAGGIQPRVDEESGDVLVFNGEIYGYREIADELRAFGTCLRDRSDTEILFQLIRRRGIRPTLDRIDGMFAFAYREGATGAIYLVRDRFGQKPLYYAVTDGQLIFGSEVTGILCHPAFAHAVPDRAAAYQFLTFEYLPGTASGWTGISKLEPGTIMRFQAGRAHIERYWFPQHLIDQRQGITEAEAVECLELLLTDAIRQQVIADVPVGIFLSGGIDSSLLAALTRQTTSDLTAFTIRIAGRGFDEATHATEVARHLDLRHELITLDDNDLLTAFDAIGKSLGEPLGDSSLLPTYALCRAARQRMKVALGGDGADELFAGYPNFIVQRFAPVMAYLPPMAAKMIAAILSHLPAQTGYMNWRFLIEQLVQGFGASVARQSFLWMAPVGPYRMQRLWHPDAMSPNLLSECFAPVDNHSRLISDFSRTDQLIYMFLVHYLPEDILTKTDRASMFNSLEVRAPFLDRKFAEYAIGLPSRLKLRGNTKKFILKKIAERHLPASIVHRKKHGFAVPIGHLIRTLFRERCQDVLLSGSNPIADWFQRPVIETLLAEHQAAKADHGKQLWSLYILFSVMGRRFITPRDDAP